jgi:hypothetical protein
MLQVDLQKLYVENKTQFTQEAFWDFIALIEARHDCIPMKWVTDELDLNLDTACGPCIEILLQMMKFQLSEIYLLPWWME